jgi:pimeloyl-ACP methyl ester carboxylesterase
LTALLIAAVAVGAAVAAVTTLLVLLSLWATRRAQSAVPPLGEFVDLAGSRLHVVDVGSGPPIVMIHGLGGTMRSFTYALLDLLTARYRVILIDRPGSGYSTRPDDRASVTHQAELLARFISDRQLGAPLIVGHSLGGAIALALALNHPQQVGALALLAPLTQLQDIPKPFRGLVIHSPRLRWLAAWTLALPLAVRNRNTSLQAIFGPDPAPADFGTRGGGLLGLRPRSFYAMSTDLMALAGDLECLAQRYHQLTQPVGVLFGSADRILDPRIQAEPLRGKIRDLQLEFVAGGGHMTPITSPARTAQFIVQMAQRVPALMKPMQPVPS